MNMRKQKRRQVRMMNRMHVLRVRAGKFSMCERRWIDGRSNPFGGVTIPAGSMGAWDSIECEIRRA